MRRRLPYHSAVVALVLTALGPDPSQAAAQPVEASADPTKELAREAYRLGTALAKQGRWRDALLAFTRAASLFAHPATSFNVAYCERALGHSTRARKYFALALKQHEKSGELSSTRAEQAQRYLDEAERKIAHLRVRIAPGSRVMADGASLSGDGASFVAGIAKRGRGTRVDVASFDLAIDAGRHVLVATGSTGQRVERRLTLRPGERRAVSLLFPPPEPPSKALAQWSVVVIGAGAAGLVTGAAFGVAALDKKSVLDERCPTPSRCPPQHAGDIDTLQRASRASTIALSIGGGVTALGITLFLYDRFGGNDATTNQDKSVVMPTRDGLVIVF